MLNFQLFIWRNSRVLKEMNNSSFIFLCCLCICNYILIMKYYMILLKSVCYRFPTFLVNYGVHIISLRTKNRPLRCEIKEVIFHKKEDKIVIAWLASTISLSLFRTQWLLPSQSLVLHILQNNKSICSIQYDILRISTKIFLVIRPVMISNLN